MHRVSIVGASGSGKTTVGRRIAEAIGAPFHELDAIHWQPGWLALDRGELRARIAEIASTERWVIDGNSAARDLVLARADAVIWLRLPRWRTTLRLVRRTAWRWLTRRPLWNGNVEGTAQVFKIWDPEHVVRWSWSSHPRHIRRYAAEIDDPELSHLRYVVLQSDADVDAFVAGLGRSASA